MNTKNIPKNIKNMDYYLCRKDISTVRNKSKKDLFDFYNRTNTSIKVFEKENSNFLELYNKLNPILSKLEYGFVYNPKTKYCNSRIFEKNKKLDNSIIYDIMIIIIESFNLKVIDNFKNYELEAIQDIIEDIHKSMHKYSIISFTDNIPHRYVLDKDYAKTFDILSRFSIYYICKLIQKELSTLFD